MYALAKIIWICTSEVVWISHLVKFVRIAMRSEWLVSISWNCYCNVYNKRCLTKKFDISNWIIIKETFSFAILSLLFQLKTWCTSYDRLYLKKKQALRAVLSGLPKINTTISTFKPFRHNWHPCCSYWFVTVGLKWPVGRQVASLHSLLSRP